MCRCHGDCTFGPTWADVEPGEGDPDDFEPTEPAGVATAITVYGRTMQPEVHEWLSHLERQVTDIIAALRAANRYTQLEDQLLLAQARYREAMNNL